MCDTLKYCKFWEFHYKIRNIALPIKNAETFLIISRQRVNLAYFIPSSQSHDCRPGWFGAQGVNRLPKTIVITKFWHNVLHGFFTLWKNKKYLNFLLIRKQLFFKWLKQNGFCFENEIQIRMIVFIGEWLHSIMIEGHTNILVHEL